MIFYLDKELKLFPLREFYNDRNRWKSEGARSDEYGEWVEYPNRAPTTFVELSKIQAAHCPNETRRPSDSLFLDVFVQLLFSIRLIGNNTSLNLSSRCLVKAHKIPFQSHQSMIFFE